MGREKGAALSDSGREDKEDDRPADDHSRRVGDGTAHRATEAGIETKIGCHTFRATGITNYLENGGTLEKAQAMANHESSRTTKLYDRRSESLSLDEVERISI